MQTNPKYPGGRDESEDDTDKSILINSPRHPSPIPLLPHKNPCGREISQLRFLNEIKTSFCSTNTKKGNQIPPLFQRRTRIIDKPGQIFPQLLKKKFIKKGATFFG